MLSRGLSDGTRRPIQLARDKTIFPSVKSDFVLHKRNAKSLPPSAIMCEASFSNAQMWCYATMRLFHLWFHHVAFRGYAFIFLIGQVARRGGQLSSVRCSADQIHHPAKRAFAI